MDHPMTQRLADLKSRKEEALHAGPPHAVERQHSKGKMTARERIEYLLDEGSFQELDMLARHRAHGMGLDDNTKVKVVTTAVEESDDDEDDNVPAAPSKKDAAKKDQAKQK